MGNVSSLPAETKRPMSRFAKRNIAAAAKPRPLTNNHVLAVLAVGRLAKDVILKAVVDLGAGRRQAEGGGGRVGGDGWVGRQGGGE